MLATCAHPKVTAMPFRVTRHSDSRSQVVAQTTNAVAAGAAAAITIALADDHKVVRSGLRVLLESDGRFVVLDEAGDVEGTLEMVRACHPRVLVLDLNMGGASSLDSIPQLRADAPDTQIVVLTMHEDPAFARAALRAGAVGYVLKEAADNELMDAVTLAAEGRTYLNPELGARLAAEPSKSDTRPDNLSPRELEVLQLIALGHTNSEIAAALRLSVRTVESHRAHIQQKVGLTTRAELVRYSRECGLLS
jgi:two-component system response regulator NreC